jgi:hypothetical protein
MLAEVMFAEATLVIPAQAGRARSAKNARRAAPKG